MAKDAGKQDNQLLRAEATAMLHKIEQDRVATLEKSRRQISETLSNQFADLQKLQGDVKHIWERRLCDMEKRVTEAEKHNGLLERKLQEAAAEKSEFESRLHQSNKEKVVLEEKLAEVEKHNGLLERRIQTDTDSHAKEKA